MKHFGTRELYDIMDVTDEEPGSDLSQCHESIPMLREPVTITHKIQQTILPQKLQQKNLIEEQCTTLANLIWVCYCHYSDQTMRYLFVYSDM